MKILCITVILTCLVLLAACGRNADAGLYTDAGLYSDEDYVVADGYVAEATPAEDAAPSLYAGTEVTTVLPVPGQLSLQDVLEMARIRREGIIKPGAERIHELTYGREPWTINIFQFIRGTRVTSVSAEDAIHDAQVFFDILRQVYGAYIYFGGDEVFLPILDQILERLAQEDTWGATVFGNLLYDYLSPVIQDNHFVINERRLGVLFEMFSPATRDSSVFDRGENGFRNRANGLYIADLRLGGESLLGDGHGLDEIFRLSLDNDGRFYYSPVIMLPFGEVVPFMITMVYECGKEEDARIRSADMRWESHDPTLRHINGIPVITVTEMGFPDSAFGHYSQRARTFLSFVDEIRDEPVVIVDIRNNGGGKGILSTMWLYALTGEVVPSNYFSLRVGDVDTTISAVTNQIMSDPFFFQNANFMKFVLPEAHGDYHTILSNHPDRIVQNDQLLILLTGRGTGSAAEHFTDVVFNMENTLVVGQNTFGVLHTDMTFSRLYLPRSGVSFGLGTTINVHPEGHLPEGIGIAPDIWVRGDALNAVLAMLGNQ